MSAKDLVKEVAARASLKSREAQRKTAAVNSFQADFELVAAHYKLRELGEYEQALECAKNDVANAKICYAAIAASLRRENGAGGINERIISRIREKLEKELDNETR